MRDLCRGGAVSMTKAFLAGVASAVDPRLWRRGNNTTTGEDNFADAFHLYYAYREQVTLVDDQLNFSALQRFGDASKRLVHDLQFRGRDDSVEPYHFSFFSSEEVSRLSSFLRVAVVVYLFENGRRARTPARLPNGNLYWLELLENEPAERRHFFLFHDYRLIAPSVEERPVVAFVVTTRSPRSLYLLEGEGAVHTLDGFAHAWFSQRAGSAGLTSPRFLDDCYAAVDAVVAGTSSLRVEELRDAGLTLESLICADRSCLYRRWAEVFARSAPPRSPLPKSFVVVVHVRMLGKNLGGLRLARRFGFLTVTVANERSSLGETRDLAEHVTDDAFVVCLFGKRYACRLREDVRRRVVELHRCAKSAKEVMLNRSNLSQVPRVLPPDEVAAARHAFEEKKKAKSAPKMTPPQPICSCEDCVSSEYADNMAANGPDRLCSIPYSLTDLLKLLGLLTDSSEALVDRLCQLSLAAMDIESQTIATHNRGPFPGPRVHYPEVGGPTFEGHVLHTQRPIMIGHTDCLSDEAGERWIDRVADDSVSAVYNLFARYWLHVSERRRVATAEKTRLAADLFEVVAKYREAHWRFTQRWSEASRLERDVFFEEELAVLTSQRGFFDADMFEALAADLKTRYSVDSEEWSMPDEDARKVAANFRSLLPGQLETQLRKLCRRYVVFNFYG